MMLAIVALITVAGAPVDLHTADTPEGRLYRAGNAWIKCSSYVAEKLLAMPALKGDPQTIAEAAADSCTDEAAIVHALAREYAASEGFSDPDAQANAIKFEVRAGMITLLRNSIAAGATHRQR